jgi:hypothetical protein
VASIAAGMLPLNTVVDSLFELDGALTDPDDVVC